jgi:hypothetical protein
MQDATGSDKMLVTLRKQVRRPAAIAWGGTIHGPDDRSSAP